MRTLIWVSLILISGHTWASTETKRITTPRGAEIEVTVHAPFNVARPTLVVAPGQSCNSKGALFESIGSRGMSAGFTVVRLEWAYCLKDPTKPTPSPDLKNEIEDLEAALSFARTLPSVDASKIVVAGKSLGSIVAYSVFRSTPGAPALALLTPVCTYTTDEDGKPLPEPERVADQNYPELKKDARPVLIALGEKDSLCLLPVLFDYLKDSKGNIGVQVAGGDHGFRLFKAERVVDEVKTEKNIQSVITGLLNWSELKTNP